MPRFLNTPLTLTQEFANTDFFLVFTMERYEESTTKFNSLCKLLGQKDNLKIAGTYVLDSG